MVCLRGGVIFTGNGQNLAESSKFDVSFDMMEASKFLVSSNSYLHTDSERHHYA